METEREKKLEKYFHEDIAKKTGLFNYFLKTVEVYLTDGRVFVGRLEVVYLLVIIFLLYRLIILYTRKLMLY